MRKICTTACLSLIASLALAQPKNDTAPKSGSDDTIIYIVIGLVVVVAAIYFLRTRKKK